MNYTEVEIVNWRKHQRKDVVKPTWFALNNRILEDPKLIDLTSDEWKVLIYIFCQASQQQSNRVKIYYIHANRICGLSEKVVNSAISRLCNVGVTSTVRARDEDVPLQDKTRQDKTEQEKECASGDALPDLALTWNALTKSLPKVKSWSPARSRLVSTLRGMAASDWEQACRKVEASDFLSGRSGRWTSCNFDWLLKKTNLTKVLEGTYDNRNQSTTITADDLADY